MLVLCYDLDKCTIRSCASGFMRYPAYILIVNVHVDSWLASSISVNGRVPIIQPDLAGACFFPSSLAIKL